MNIATLFQDIHGNASTKRLCGFLCILVGLGMAVCTGFDWYEVDATAYVTVLSAGTGLLASTSLERKPADAGTGNPPTA